MNRQRKTKIVCTIGPASDDTVHIRNLIRAGMDVVRLNFSHGDHQSHARTIQRLRRVMDKEHHRIAILQDLGGPKIRLGIVKGGERTLETGSQVKLVPGTISHDDTLPVNYPHLTEDVKEGDRILLADGMVELKVVHQSTEALTCQVLVGGRLQSHKGVNLPSSPLRIPAFTEKDRADLAFGLQQGIDFVALSFVRSREDVEPVKTMLSESPNKPLLIAKIERPQALENFDEILSAVDGIMVARGDLGVETPLHEVPIIQKELIQGARSAAKPVITATQMLSSMVTCPRPTRAETTDVANAILDGTDALMLSDETAMGKYPVEAVKMLDRIATATEKYFFEKAPSMPPVSTPLPGTDAAISHAVYDLANDLDAAAIIASTASGSTARLVSRLRPQSPVFGFTHSEKTYRQLRLSWGITPVLVTRYTDTDSMFTMARKWVVDQGIARKGDRIVLTAGVPIGKTGTTNMIKVLEI